MISWQTHQLDAKNPPVLIPIFTKFCVTFHQVSTGTRRDVTLQWRAPRDAIR